MSRHRNVRHLVAEEDYYDDDYDDDYDDYGDDGYDDYDDQYQRPTAQAPKQQQQQQAKTKAQQQSNNNTVSFAANTTNKAIPKAKAKTPPRPRGGVTTPPPGFSATPPPSSRQQQPSSSAKKGGIATPPPGFSTAPPSPHKSPQPFGLPGSAPNSPVPTTSTNVMTTATPKNSRPSTPTQQQTPSSQNSKRPPPPPVPPILLRDDDPNAKPTLTCVILGHVDAGKSTLTGQLLWANAHDKTLSSNSSSNSNNNDLYAATPPRDKRKPKNLAWLLDEDEQERQHGITMEVATKTLYTPQYRLVLQDAPGHADYVPNFIAGTAAADAAVAVVDVTDTQQSALARGQLREHLYLAKGLGVSHVIVALNKMDVLEWDQGKYQAFVSSLSNFLFQSAGFAKAKVQFVPISGLQGVNVYQRLQKAECPQLTSWYKGPTLWEAMQALELPNPSTTTSNSQQQQQQPTTTRRRKLLEKPLRLLLTDILQEQGKGVAVRAKLVAGWLGSHVDPRLTILPLGDTATVGKLVHVQENLSTTTTGVAAADNNATDDDNENRSNYAVAGDLVDLVLSGVDVARLTVGNVLIRPQDTTLVPAKQCRCRIYVLENLTTPIIRGATAMFHIHSIQVPCYLSQLVKSLVKGQTKGNSGEEVWKEKPRALTKQSQAVVDITLQQAAGVVMEAFSDCRALGRFVLRRSGESIAVGRIEQVLQ